MLKKIAIVVIVLIAGILAFAATKPNEFRVERSAVVNGPPDRVFALLNDFHNWPAWSPWEKLDPNMKRTHSGSASGVGAVYNWEGNSDVGKGRMEIVESTSPSHVGIKLDFLEPMEANNKTDFTLTPEGSGTRVQWAMHGPNNFMSKVMQVFMSMDSMIGKDFEAGLANMNAAVQK